MAEQARPRSASLASMPSKALRPLEKVLWPGRDAERYFRAEVPLKESSLGLGHMMSLAQRSWRALNRCVRWPLREARAMGDLGGGGEFGDGGFGERVEGGVVDDEGDEGDEGLGLVWLGLAEN